jgi:signal transduction histidine kinase
VTDSSLRLSGRRVQGPIAFALLLAVGAIVVTVAGGSFAEIVGSGSMILGYGTAGVLMFRRSASLPPVERRPWQVLAAALMMSSLGLLVFVAMLPSEPPVFGPIDAWYVLIYAVVVVALALLARVHDEGPPWGLTMLDMAVAGVAATAIIWELVLGDLTEIAVSGWERAGLSLYPILDVAIIVGLCLVALRRSRYQFDVRILLVAAGVVAQIAGDITYLRGGVVATTFQEAEPKFGLFMIAAAFLVLAAAFVDRPAVRREFPEREVPLWAIIWPYLLAGALIPIHVFRVNELYEQVETTGVPARTMTDGRVVLYAILAVGVLIIVRQWVAIRHNRARVERQRKDLIASVSHELRTPLTAIVGFLQVLVQDPDAFSEEEKASMMEEISHQAKHMSRTVTDLITLARDGGAKMMIRSSEASLVDIVTAATSASDRAKLSIDLDDHPLWVDADRLEQAIVHLLANAEKYGHGRIHVRARVRGGTLDVEVHDEGPGIPTRHLSSVWNQFDRGARRLDSTSPGLGIGLAIVRAVAAAHGGTASYRPSELLGGSCFTISIPANARTGAPWIRELAGR